MARRKLVTTTVGDANFVCPVRVVERSDDTFDVTVMDIFWSDYDTEAEAIEEAKRLIANNLNEWND